MVTPHEGAAARLPATLTLLATLAGGGCAPGEEPLEPALRLLAFRQAGDTEVCLDEPLVLDFSEELDRASITGADGRAPGSLRILDEEGMPARGQLSINPKQVVFRPHLARLSDLSDGGFRPGTTYRVELVGFPRPDGVRARSGALLEGSLTLSFRTADAEGPGALFHSTLGEDGSLPVMALVARTIEPEGPLVLECPGAVDPRSLHPGEFQLTPLEGSGHGSVVFDAIPLAPVLAENLAHSARRRGLGLARLELHPSRALREGTYLLTRPETRLVGLGGQSMAMPSLAWGPLRVNVARPEEHEETLDLSGSSQQSGEEPLGMDGTAVPSPYGEGLMVRLLAAAGDGRDGDVRPFQGRWDGVDLQATRLEVPAGALADLGDREGCLVLRAQGALSVAGTLRRGRPRGAPRRTEPAFVSSADPSTWTTLSRWLADVQGSGEAWTILIAGGELRIEGRIEVEGPLVLVAGGHVRVAEGARVVADSLYKSPEGGDNLGRVKLVPLHLDPPARNPLAEPLRFAALTPPFRPPGGVRSWLSAEPSVRAGTGRVLLQAYGLRDPGPEGGPVALVGPVERLADLDGCAALRLLTIFELPAARADDEPWRSPLVDAARLRWTAPRPSGRPGERE